MRTRATQERREFGRRRSALHGWLLIDGRPRIPCLVRNISEGGALVECEVPKTLPFRFRLAIDSKGFRAECELRHQSDTWVGVRFTAVEATREPIAEWQPLE